MNQTALLVDRIASINLRDLPEPVIEAAKYHFLDSLGCQLAGGASAQPPALVERLVDWWGGRTESSVIGRADKLPAPHAALMNALFAHSVELDDAHDDAFAKVGSCINPSVVALSEAVNATGAQAIEAIVAGYEAAIRIALAINPSHRQRGFHTSGTAGTFGVAAACARLLGLEEREINSALGLATMQAAGIQPYLTSPSVAKPMNLGKAAFNGILCALLAAEGFSGPADALESREGFFRAYADQVNAESFTGWGDKYLIQEVGFKPHSACRYAHGPIDAAQELYRKHKLTAKDIESVRVEVSTLAKRQAGGPGVESMHAAMGSIPFGVVLGLTTGSNGLSDYRTHHASKELQELANGVEVVAAEAPGMGLAGRATRLVVRTERGEVIEAAVAGPRGGQDSPLSTDELQRKYASLAESALDVTAVEQVRGNALALESLTSLDQITSQLRTAKRLESAASEERPRYLGRPASRT